MALLCLIFSNNVKSEKVVSPHHTSQTGDDSTRVQKLKHKLDHRKSRFIFETGIVSGPLFTQGNYVGFEYTHKTDRLIKPSLFINCSSIGLKEDLTYLHETSYITRQRNLTSNITETHTTEQATLTINSTEVIELGAAFRYDITKGFSIKSAVTFNSLGFIRGSFRERIYDSTYLISPLETKLTGTGARNKGGSHYDDSPQQSGFNDFFSFHLGIEQKLSRRLRLTGRASLPLTAMFPKTIKYPEDSVADAEEMELNGEEKGMQPLFIKVGVSLTI